MARFTTKRRALSKQSFFDRFTPLKKVTITPKNGGGSYTIKFRGKALGGPESGPTRLEGDDQFSQSSGLTVLEGGVGDGFKDSVIYDGEIVSVEGPVKTKVEKVGTFPIWGLSAMLGGILAIWGLSYMDS